MVLAAAGGSLAVDRALLGGGGPASAHAALPPDAGSSAASAGLGVTPPKSIRPQLEEIQPGRLATKLAGLATDEPIADLLALRHQAVDAPVLEPATERPPEPVVALPVPELHVSSIMISDRGRRAKVNRTSLVVGDSLAGATLKEINRDGLVFDFGGQRLEVPLRQE